MSDVTDTYYASEANIGYGAQWLIGQDDGSPETFVAVTQVSNIDIGEMVAAILNKTHLRSPGRAHEKLSGMRDVNAFTITGQLNLKHGSHNNAGGDGFTNGGMVAIHRRQDERNMKVIIPDGSPESVVEFAGVISSLDLGELSLEGIQMFTAQVQPLADWTEGLP